MSADYGKKEQEFLKSLQPDTGRSLETWLALIQSSRLTERNDIIDWLRQEGFTFSRASWLERIFHNGGQPIYGEPAAQPAPTSSRDADYTPAPPPHQSTENIGATGNDKLPSEPNSPVNSSLDLSSHQTPLMDGKETIDENLERALAGAKGLRPLAHHIVQVVQATTPDTTLKIEKALIAFLKNNTRFAGLAIAAKGLKFGLALPHTAIEAPFEPAHFPLHPARNTEFMTHMLSIDDVRAFDTGVIEMVKRAADGPFRAST